MNSAKTSLLYSVPHIGYTNEPNDRQLTRHCTEQKRVGEFYFAPLYASLIVHGARVVLDRTQAHPLLGTRKSVGRFTRPFRPI